MMGVPKYSPMSSLDDVKLRSPRKSSPLNNWIAKAQPRKTRELSLVAAKTVAMPASAQATIVASRSRHSGAIRYRKASPAMASGD